MESGGVGSGACGHSVCALCILKHLEQLAAEGKKVSYPFPCGYGAWCSMKYGYAAVRDMLNDLDGVDQEASKRLEKFYKDASGGEGKQEWGGGASDAKVGGASQKGVRPSYLNAQDVVIDIPPMVGAFNPPNMNMNMNDGVVVHHRLTFNEAFKRVFVVLLGFLVLFAVVGGIGYWWYKSCNNKHNTCIAPPPPPPKARVDPDLFR